VSGPSSVPSVEKVISGVPQAPQIESQLSGSAKAAVKEAFLLGNIGFGFAGPPGVPANRLDALRTAFMKVMSSSSVKAEAIKQSLSLGPMSGATLAQKVRSAESSASVLSPYIQ
jgi:hypothetical protein